MTEYVAGFLLDGQNNVALVLKNRPAWQKGLYNGIGGHIENGESPVEAMTREFFEETTVTVPTEDWQNFATLRGANWTVYFFVAYQEEMPVLCSPTDETIVVRSIQSINYWHNSLPNLTWLLPLAKNVLWKRDGAKHFEIKEEY